jgi:hypothetical protein
MKKIGTWIFLGLAAIIVIVAILFYVNLGSDSMISTILNLGYVLIIAGILLAICSAVFAAMVKGVNIKTLGILLAVVAVLAIVAFLMSKGSFSTPYIANGQEYSSSTHGWVEFGLNFTYLTAGVSVLAILFSTIYKAIK